MSFDAVALLVMESGVDAITFRMTGKATRQLGTEMAAAQRGWKQVLPRGLLDLKRQGPCPPSPSRRWARLGTAVD
jgi:hypothetical protein